MVMSKGIWVGDLESNGFLDVAHTIWCGAFNELGTDNWRIINSQKSMEVDLRGFFEGAHKVIMHNGIGFDLNLMKKVINYDCPYNKIIDTLILSKLLNPDRKVPVGWVGKHKPHSIEAWGMRFGIPKPQHEQWDHYSEEMLHRCREDVKIGGKVFQYLMNEEASLQLQDQLILN